MTLFTFFKDDNVVNLFSMFSAGFSEHKIRVLEVIFSKHINGIAASLISNAFLLLFELQIKPVGNGLTLPDLGEVVPTGESVEIDADHNIIFYVLFTQILCAYFCYIFGNFFDHLRFE